MNIAQKAHIAWQLTLVLFACVLIGIGMDHAVLRPIFHWPKWLVQTLPLLALLPGLLKRQSRAAIWLCFMQLFYFLVFVEHVALDPGHRGIYIALTLLCIALFTTSMLFARWCKQSSAQTPIPDACVAEDTSP